MESKKLFGENELNNWVSNRDPHAVLHRGGWDAAYALTDVTNWADVVSK